MNIDRNHEIPQQGEFQKISSHSGDLVLVEREHDALFSASTRQIRKPPHNKCPSIIAAILASCNRAVGKWRTRIEKVTDKNDVISAGPWMANNFLLRFCVVAYCIVVEGDSRFHRLTVAHVYVFIQAQIPDHDHTKHHRAAAPAELLSSFPLFSTNLFSFVTYGSIVQVLCMYTTTPQEANTSESKDTFSTPHTFLSFYGLYVACLEVAELNQARSKPWRPR